MAQESKERRRWRPIDPGWAWVETALGRQEIFGAAPQSPARAWALGLASSEARMVDDLCVLEARRDEGHIELVRASRRLCEAWAVEGREIAWRLHEGVAVTQAEQERLTRTSPAQRDQPRRGPS